MVLPAICLSCGAYSLHCPDCSGRLSLTWESRGTVKERCDRFDLKLQELWLPVRGDAELKLQRHYIFGSLLTKTLQSAGQA